ncbi:MAG: hypothetical protein JSU07_12380 [Bacteroidetes bacterium]|nr:hypothetical protein [Bacteroidota bacterium]
MEANIQDKKIEIIIVFKIDITEEFAENYLTKLGIAFREGMDSSKGKIYFYSTGPKYILTFTSEKDKKEFMSKHAKDKEIHEIYTPNWKIQKD